MQTAGYFIASAAKFTACVKNSEDCFYSGTTGIGLDIDRNAASVIGYGDTVVLFDRNLYLCRKTGQRFIDGIIHDFPDQMVQTRATGRANVHSGTFADCFQSFQNLDLTGIIFLSSFSFVLFVFYHSVTHLPFLLHRFLYGR
ncbi:hypothetical protein SDC9_58125 [bioreactor metagenome]|uniref:Uncharacterized protein n=1 Tax=bioreactor metagenome TaxID=1076179 RepID=A0A644XC72_9ZZZZ